jgi:hypothetical protein
MVQEIMPAPSDRYKSHVELPIMETGSKVKKTVMPWRSNNHTLVVLIGDLRCGEKAWSSLYENVLDYLQADLALFTQPAPQVEYQDASLVHRAMHVEMLPEYADWAEALDLISGAGWRERVAAAGYSSTSHPMLLGGAEKYTASGAIVNMYKWVAANRIRQLWQGQYDRFVVTRTDQFYHCPLNVPDMDPSFIWVPEGEDYSGITDRFFIASADKVIPALDILTPFLKDPGMYFSSLPPETNPEYYMKNMWTYDGLWPHHVRRFPRVMFTCIADVDRTRWGTMHNLVNEGVHLKYPTEYDKSKRVCKA